MQQANLLPGAAVLAIELNAKHCNDDCSAHAQNAHCVILLGGPATFAASSLPDGRFTHTCSTSNMLQSQV